MSKKYSLVQVNAILEKAITKWGKIGQIVECIEECSELQKELCKFINADGENYKASILEEMVDVQIMLYQMRIIFCTPKEFNQVLNEKIERLEGRLDGPRLVS